MNNYQVYAIVVLAAVISSCLAQHGLSALYYQQVAAEAGHRAAAGASSGGLHTGGGGATPIFEPNTNPSQQYIAQQQQQPQQIRYKEPEQPRQQAPPQHTQAYVAPTVRQYLQQPQPQQTQPQYVPQSQQQTLSYKSIAPKIHQTEYQQPSAPAKQNKDSSEDYDPNPSYQFGFDVKDDEFTNYQNRKEVRDGNVIKGSYSVVDSDGFIRTVKYTADPKEGFKAEVIREPTDIVVKYPTPAPPQQQQQQQQHHEPQQLYKQQGSPQQYLSQQQVKAPQPQYHYQ